MHHLIYFSRATQAFADQQLQDLLTQARLRNAALGITGILLYGNDQFVQVLEGEEQAVLDTYERICRDPRHRAVTLFANKAIAVRSYEGWGMYFHPMGPATLRELVGLVKPAELAQALLRPNLGQADKHMLQLLCSFVLPQ